MTDDIESRIDDIESVIEQLEAGDLSLAEAKDKYETAMADLDALREDLAVGEGTVSEIDPDTPTDS